MLEIHDHEGNRIATKTVGSQPWPGTGALFPVEFELESPAHVGQVAWNVIAPALKSETSDTGDGVLQHETARASFNLRTVPAGEFQLTVLAIDRQSQLPVPGLRVVVHPYRATTDVDGVARLHLPKGRYTVFVSGKNFFPLRLEGELTADLTIDAELEVDREPTDAELWS
jgi:hypothetical protein